MHPKWRQILKTFIIGVTVLSVPYSASAQNTGKISGIVVGDDGRLLTAVVTAHRQGMPAASGRADAAADGSFSITGLPAGAYGLCAVVINGGYLDPCAWSAVIPSVQLDAGKAVTAYRLTLTKGDLLQVRVNDQSQVLGKSAAPGNTANFVMVGVFTDRHIFQPLGITGKDASGQNHEGTIPFDKDVSLHVEGKGVDIKDAAGAAVDPNGTTITVKHSSGKAPPLPTTFSVTPRKP